VVRPLVVGVSHRSAAAGLLERVALTPAAAEKLAVDVAAALDEVGGAGTPGESVVLSTCNRVEVYAAAAEFHRTVSVVTELLARHTGVAVADLEGSLEVRWDRAARAHVFAVAAGLESVVQGEPQILGQVRTALRTAQDAGTVGPVLNSVLQHALRLGKRVQSETRAGAAGPSLVSVALDLAPGVDGGTAVVVGAGSLAGLAVAELRRRGIARLTVVNRSAARAVAVAGGPGAAPGVAGAGSEPATAATRVLALADTAGLVAALAAADVVVSCTGASGPVLSEATVAAALAGRGGRVLTVLDLSLPHDLEPAAAALSGLSVLDLDTVAASGLGHGRAEDLARAAALVDVEIEALDVAERAAASMPAVVALRELAAGVVDGELERLRSRTPGLRDADRAEVERTVHRVVDKLLHRPSVRVRELAGAAGADGPDYADALRQLFALDPQAVGAVAGARAPGVVAGARTGGAAPTRPDPAGAAAPTRLLAGRAGDDEPR